MNVEGENRREITILVQVVCIYPSRCSMIHATHIFAPSKGLHPRSPLKPPSGMDSPPRNIRVYRYTRVD